MRIVILLLQLAAANLLYADQVQTHFWAPGAWGSPVELSANMTVIELNPILAGHPERVDGYFNALKLAVIAAPFILSRDRTLLLLIGAVIVESAVVWHNANVLERAGVNWDLLLPKD